MGVGVSGAPFRNRPKQWHVGEKQSIKRRPERTDSALNCAQQKHDDERGVLDEFLHGWRETGFEEGREGGR